VLLFQNHLELFRAFNVGGAITFLLFAYGT
jgi:hypothetical protein